MGVTPWIIAACELYLHGGCTSFLEAASLEKNSIFCFIRTQKES